MTAATSGSKLYLIQLPPNDSTAVRGSTENQPEVKDWQHQLPVQLSVPFAGLLNIEPPPPASPLCYPGDQNAARQTFTALVIPEMGCLGASDNPMTMRQEQKIKILLAAPQITHPDNATLNSKSKGLTRGP